MNAAYLPARSASAYLPAEVSGHFGSTADVSYGHFGSAAEVSYCRSVLLPKCP